LLKNPEAGFGPQAWRLSGFGALGGLGVRERRNYK
jgi:hypothetical protein